MRTRYMEPTNTGLCTTLSLMKMHITVLEKTRYEEKRKRSKQMKTEENTMYGTYEDGPVYNIVTDENTYYGS